MKNLVYFVFHCSYITQLKFKSELNSYIGIYSVSAKNKSVFSAYKQIIKVFKLLSIQYKLNRFLLALFFFFFLIFSRAKNLVKSRLIVSENTEQAIVLLCPRENYCYMYTPSNNLRITS